MGGRGFSHANQTTLTTNRDRQGTARELIRGTYKLKDRLLLILDIERVVSLKAGN